MLAHQYLTKMPFLLVPFASVSVCTVRRTLRDDSLKVDCIIQWLSQNLHAAKFQMMHCFRSCKITHVGIVPYSILFFSSFFSFFLFHPKLLGRWRIIKNRSIETNTTFIKMCNSKLIYRHCANDNCHQK